MFPLLFVAGRIKGTAHIARVCGNRKRQRSHGSKLRTRRVGIYSSTKILSDVKAWIFRQFWLLFNNLLKALSISGNKFFDERHLECGFPIKRLMCRNPFDLFSFETVFQLGERKNKQISRLWFSLERAFIASFSRIIIPFYCLRSINTCHWCLLKETRIFSIIQWFYFYFWPP